MKKLFTIKKCYVVKRFEVIEKFIKYQYIYCIILYFTIKYIFLALKLKYMRNRITMHDINI